MQVVSHFPYEAADENTPCLKKETELVGQMLVEMLQKKVDVAGTKIHSFQLKVWTA